MKKIFCFFLIIILSSIIFGQNQNDNNCGLQAQNQKWENDFKKASKYEKVRLIKEKIKSDSIYTQFQSKNTTSEQSAIYNEFVDYNKNRCDCKILFVLNYAKKKSIYLNLNSNPELTSIVEKLNTKNIENIFFLFDKKAKTLYSTASECGFVQVNVRNRKLKKLIKKLYYKNS